jgi:acetylglutamate kinase
MVPKLDSCISAIQAGVHSVHILDGRVQHALLLEIFTPHGIGTMIER